MIDQRITRRMLILIAFGGLLLGLHGGVLLIGQRGERDPRLADQRPAEDLLKHRRGDADHAERFRALLRLGDIGDVGLRQR
jgi:hypothetical protein